MSGGSRFRLLYVACLCEGVLECSPRSMKLESLFFEGSRSSLVRPLVSLFPRKRIGRLCVVD